jgi:ABC-2 type transport system ATP-binding protein
LGLFVTLNVESFTFVARIEFMNAIVANSISKSYGKFKALNEVSISIQEGEIFGLLGPNGAGKTTFIRILNQIIEPDSGSVSFFNEPLERRHVEWVGYLPEERGLYRKMKVGEQCLYLAQLKGLKLKDARKELIDWFEKFEITSWWNKRVEDLSKGMAQKIQFITTVVHKPKLLILDEPFSGFDPINAQLIEDEMIRLKSEGSTIILSTHDMGSVESLCDRIGLIHQSNLLLNGTVKEIRDTYKTRTFIVEFKGTQLDMTIALAHLFELKEVNEMNGIHVAEIQIPESRNLNNLLQILIPHIEVVSVKEKIPSVHDIFVKTVQSQLEVGNE